MLPEYVLDTGKYTSCSFRVMSLEKVQSNSQIRQGRVTVLCTALLITVIYKPAKFLVDISYGFRGYVPDNFKK
jgi:hypothetical protein